MAYLSTCLDSFPDCDLALVFLWGVGVGLGGFVILSSLNSCSDTFFTNLKWKGVHDCIVNLLISLSCGNTIKPKLEHQLKSEKGTTQMGF